MERYKVGEKFPRQHIPKSGVPTARIVGSSFDALLSIDNPKADEIKIFKNGIMRLHVNTVDHIPLVAVSYLESNWTWDFSINVVGMNAIEESEFFTSGNSVTMVLIDSPTGVTKAIRTVGLTFEIEQLIKDSCREQLRFYSNTSESMSAISRILSRITTEDLIKTGVCMEFKGR